MGRSVENKLGQYALTRETDARGRVYTMAMVDENEPNLRLLAGLIDGRYDRQMQRSALAPSPPSARRGPSSGATRALARG